jgi:hypothetical protein
VLDAGYPGTPPLIIAKLGFDIKDVKVLINSEPHGAGGLAALQKASGAELCEVPANGRVMTGREIVRHRDMYQKLFTTMIGYLNMGLGPEDAVQRKRIALH